MRSAHKGHSRILCNVRRLPMRPLPSPCGTRRAGAYRATPASPPGLPPRIACDARQRQFQLHRLGRGRNKQPALRGLRLHRVDIPSKRARRAPPADALPDRAAAVSETPWYPAKAPAGAACARACRAVFQFEAQAEFVGGQRARGQARGQSVHQARQQEGQRLQQLHRIIQLDLVFETQRIFERKQLALRLRRAPVRAGAILRGRAVRRCPSGGSAASS